MNIIIMPKIEWKEAKVELFCEKRRGMQKLILAIKYKSYYQIIVQKNKVYELWQPLNERNRKGISNRKIRKRMGLDRSIVRRPHSHNAKLRGIRICPYKNLPL